MSIHRSTREFPVIRKKKQQSIPECLKHICGKSEKKKQIKISKRTYESLSIDGHFFDCFWSESHETAFTFPKRYKSIVDAIFFDEINVTYACYFCRIKWRKKSNQKNRI